MKYGMDPNFWNLDLNIIKTVQKHTFEKNFNNAKHSK